MDDAGLPGDARLDTTGRGSDASERVHISRILERLTLVFSHLGKALEAYQRQLISNGSPFDQFVERLRDRGKHLLAPEFNQQALRGLLLFVGKGQCTPLPFRTDLYRS